ncbi:MAG: TVP38/TMEM64 family protein [Planctomycetota bacterium]
MLPSPDLQSTSAADLTTRWLRILAATAIPLLLLFIGWCLLKFPFGTWRAAATPSEQVQILQAWFRAFGVGAPVAYVLFVTIEVVAAPIPGLLLYAPGGLIFGAIPGGLLALAGNVLGAGISCALARRLGGPFVRKLDSEGRLEDLQQRFTRHGFWVILLLRLNPLTSSDLVSWAAGLSRIPLLTVMSATALGMAPLCLLQSWLSDSLFQAWPGLLGPLLILTAILGAGVFLVLLRLSRNR